MGLSFAFVANKRGVCAGTRRKKMNQSGGKKYKGSKKKMGALGRQQQGLQDDVESVKWTNKRFLLSLLIPVRQLCKKKVCEIFHQEIESFQKKNLHSTFF